MHVINLLGGPNSGKSTAAFGLAHKMKMNHLCCEYVGEYAKELVYSEHFNVLETQNYIFAEQEQRLHRLKDKVDWVITDTSLLLSLVYYPDWYPKSFGQFVLDMYRLYNNENYYFARPDVFQQYGRMHDLEESIEIDNEVIRVLKKHDISYTMVTANDTVVDDIYDSLFTETQNINKGFGAQHKVEN